jgi:nicotinate-nucleotide--dimethylbenzimidazole phosphoribosyltransferase
MQTQNKTRMKTFQIHKPDEASVRLLIDKINNLTKPNGSLGRLRNWLCSGTDSAIARTTLRNPQNIIFAADNGIVDEGVSFHPKRLPGNKSVTSFVVVPGSTSSVVSMASELKIVDAGVDYDFPAGKGIFDFKVRKGTRNFLYEAAMTREEARFVCIDVVRK